MCLTFFSHACGPLVDSSSELRTWAPVEPVKRPGTVLDWAHASTYHSNRTFQFDQTVRIVEFIRFNTPIKSDHSAQQRLYC